LFFSLRPGRSVLSDRNERLIRCYEGVKRHPKKVIALLKAYRNEKRFYLSVRKQEIDKGSDVEVAAWLIYLNKTGYNGLYRVNSKNRFNVPYGDNKNARFCDEDNLRACAQALSSAELFWEDFTAVLGRAKRGDLVYFDPPYVPLSMTSYFTSYTALGFSMDDQIKLRDVALELKKRGVFVLVSNSSAPAVYELYADFERIPVAASRMVNSNPAGRGKVTELLIR
jgi:DNA adenine methylase